MLHTLRLHHRPHRNSEKYHTELGYEPYVDMWRWGLVIKCHEGKENTRSSQARREYLSRGEFLEPEIIEQIALAKCHKNTHKSQNIADMRLIHVVKCIHIETK